MYNSSGEWNKLPSGVEKAYLSFFFILKFHPSIFCDDAAHLQRHHRCVFQETYL